MSAKQVVWCSQNCSSGGVLAVLRLRVSIVARCNFALCSQLVAALCWGYTAHSLEVCRTSGSTRLPGTLGRLIEAQEDGEWRA